MARTAIHCELISAEQTVTLGQLCRSCGVHAEWITLLVQEGVLEPCADPRANDETPGWRFSATELPRVHTAVRLQRDLGLNTAGLALALELIDENRQLKNRLDAFEDRAL